MQSDRSPVYIHHIESLTLLLIILFQAEFPLPEQFKSVYNGKKFVTDCTESVWLSGYMASTVYKYKGADTWKFS